MTLNIKKEVKNLKRFKEIVTVLFEEGYDYIIENIRLKKHVALNKRIGKKKELIPPEIRLRKTLERLGPTFIKFGQVLSVRPDLLPKNYILELEKLQDKVPATPFKEIKEVVEKETGESINKKFKSFSKVPIASASISQVHKAVLHDGQIVAAKVQRPNVIEIMNEDIKIMLYFARLLERHYKDSKKYEPLKIIEEFKKWTENELNFLLEARNAKVFANNFKEEEDIKIPLVYDEHTTSKVLVLEYIDGVLLNDVKECKKRKIDVKQFIEIGFNAIMKQVFIDGFFHADPHPGNLIVTNDKKLAFIDFGIIGRFDEELKIKSIEMLNSLVFNDVNRLVNVLLDMGLDIDQDFEVESFKDELRTILDPVQVEGLGSVKLSRVIEEVLHISLEYNLRMPVQFSLLGKTIITLEGIGIEYNPKFKLVDKAKPFFQELIIERYKPTNIATNVMKNAINFKNFAERFPNDATKVLRRIQKGTIKVDLSDTDIKRLSLEIDRSSNRVAYSMLIGAFVIAGALTLGIEMGPRIFDLPIISFVSFTISVLFFIILLYSIFNEKRNISRIEK